MGWKMLSWLCRDVPPASPSCLRAGGGWDGDGGCLEEAGVGFELLLLKSALKGFFR